MSNKLFLYSFLACAFFCCGKKQQQEIITSSEEYSIHYAKGFQVVKTEDYTHVTVRNPWDTTTILQSYILVSNGEKLPDQLPKGHVIKVPISEAAITSSIQASVLERLDALNIITGVCEPEYIKSQYIQDKLSRNEIVNLGMASSPNTESLILISPDVVFSDPVTGQSQANIERTRIPIIQTPDYTEPHPLGRAEWIRFYSLFLGKETLGDSLFSETAKKYNEIKDKISSAEYKPTVFTDIRYQGSWNMAGGKSFLATLYKDAGADYIWSDNESTTFIPLSFEAVLEKAGNADIWIIRYNADQPMTYNSLEKEYKPHSYFKAFKEKHIYGCNARYANYFEDLPIHPDYILQDLAYVFHPSLFPNYKPKYYKPLDN